MRPLASVPARLLPLVLPLALPLLAAAPLQAQSFVFVSDRVPAGGPPQNDLFMYRDGSEIRLTATPSLEEFDPEPSPDGRLIAYAETDRVAGADAPGGPWRWRYVVRELGGETGARFDIANAAGTLRPAGGFGIAWLPDGGGFLGQAVGADGTWEVRRYDLFPPAERAVAPGFGVRPSPDGRWLATRVGERVRIVDLGTGASLDLTEGVPLAWTPDGRGLIVGRDAQLLLLGPLPAPPFPPEGEGGGSAAGAPAGGVTERVLDDNGPYLRVRWNPSADRYAAVAGRGRGEGRVLALYGADHAPLGVVALDAVVVDFDWLDDARALLELTRGEPGREDHVIALLGGLDPSLASGRDAPAPVPLVGGPGRDGAPRRLP